MVRMLRDALPMDDAERIAEIYNHYIATDTATFEVDPIGEAAMAQRIAAAQSAGLPWIVATDVLGIIGYAYAAPFHERAAYARTVTASVYLDRAARGRGVGTALYRELLRRLEALDEGVHAPVESVVALIALPNDASVALHESLGFEKRGHLERVGRKFDRWIDVGYWQRAFGDAPH
jgi:phosphinothricin acetyltransferase